MVFDQGVMYIYMYIYMCVYIYVCVCVCVCVCVNCPIQANCPSTSISQKHFVIFINYADPDYVLFSVLLFLPFLKAQTLTRVFTLSCHLSCARLISYCVQPLLRYRTTASKTELL
jgi:hypothetical protein